MAFAFAAVALIEGASPATEEDGLPGNFDEGLAQKLGSEIALTRPAGVPAALDDLSHAA